MQTNSDDATTQAAELAERILDAVSDAEQDWRLVERWARELAENGGSGGRTGYRLCEPPFF